MSETAHQHPTVEERPEQTYVAVRRSVRTDGFAVTPTASRDLRPAGLARHRPGSGPFFRFHTADMAAESDVGTGVPVLSVPAPEGGIAVGNLPAGRYGTPTHSGHPDELVDAITGWAAEQGLEWDTTAGPDGAERWGCRIESHLTDPSVEPDMERRETVACLPPGRLITAAPQSVTAEAPDLGRNGSPLGFLIAAWGA
ncbi:GyrI-like domain-containing protein [Streptomyces sp. NPDC019645]|uniref:GyrI-like domain-containing protein n=1 Tax=Streptomyces sp. NPDC019645 TaxID=3154786 RepID=UPI0033DEA679